MAEQLRLDEGLRERRAVHRDERPVGARARLMDRPRQHLLPGPALAGEQHRRPGGGDLAGVVDRRQEPGRPADDGVEPEALVERGPQRRHLPLERPGFRLGGAQPLLVLGQPLVLDLERERHGDHARDFGVGFVVPVRTRRHEEQDAAHALAEEDRYVERRAVAVLDHQPVAGTCGIELTRSVPDEDDLAAGDTLQFGELLEVPDSGFTRPSPPTRPTRSKRCSEPVRKASPITSKSMRAAPPRRAARAHRRA